MQNKNTKRKIESSLRGRFAPVAIETPPLIQIPAYGAVTNNTVGADAHIGPVILLAKSHCRKAIRYDFLRKSQYFLRKYWAGRCGHRPLQPISQYLSKSEPKAFIDKETAGEYTI
jgi:hypothetical protein